MQFTISINRPGPKGNLNLNVTVDAPDIVAALEAAKEELTKTIEASGLALAPAAPAAPVPAPS